LFGCVAESPEPVVDFASSTEAIGAETCFAAGGGASVDTVRVGVFAGPAAALALPPPFTTASLHWL
jgi:hypothetical protein